MNPKFRFFIAMLLVAALGCSPPALFENEYAPAVAGESSAAMPTGMRRTKNGWEDSTYWSLGPTYQPSSVNAWVDVQRSREPVWVRRLLDRVRDTPPLMIAVIQIAAIAAIFQISQFNRRDSKSDSERALSGDSLEGGL